MLLRFLVAACLSSVAASLAIANPASNGQASKPASPGWTLPPDADTTKNPLPVGEKLIASGKALFAQKCRRCHGPGGLGDGPDAEPDLEEMNLTNPKRAARNSDGVVFYKVANGRSKPKMPAFENELTNEQIWAVVAYTQTLRRKS